MSRTRKQYQETNIHALNYRDIVITGTLPQTKKFQEGTPYYIEYNPNKNSDQRCICAPADIKKLELLGFKVTPHWMPELAKRGFGAVYYANFQTGHATLSPKVMAYLNQNVTNNHFTNLLKKSKTKNGEEEQLWA